MKIYVIGPAGSGKTTLAKQASKVLSCSHTDLDDIFWDNQQNSFGIKRDESTRNEINEKVLNQESWIIEGAYLSWPEEGFKYADKLIFLDFKNYILTFRIIRRFIQRKFGFHDCKKKETLSNLIELLKWNTIQAIKMKDYFHSEKEDYPNLIRLSSNREINDFLNEIATL